MTLKGSMQLEVDEKALEAALVFFPDDTGDSWDPLKVRNLLQESRFEKEPEKEEIEEALSRLVNSSEVPARTPILLGEPPQAAIPESVEWKDHPIPEKLEALARAILKKASAPDIEISRTEKRKVTEKKEKKGLFGSKQEDVVRTERVKIPEKVDVNPHVQAEGFAEKDALLGEITAMQPGESGRDLYGQMIPPPELDDLGVLPGKNCTRKGNQIFADYDGVYRCGQNWVELFPLENHHWEITVSSDNATCYLNFHFGDERIPLPSSQEILNLCGEKGFNPEVLLESDQLDSILNRHSSAKEDLLNFSLSLDRDGSYEVHFSPNRIRAYLSVYKGRGKGKQLSLKAILEDLGGRGFAHFDAGYVKKELKSFYSSPELDLVDLVVSEGKDPERGPDRELRIKVKGLSEEELADKKEKLGENPCIGRNLKSLEAFPLDDVELMAFVSEGEKLAELGGGRKGKSGKDVFGQTVEGYVGNDPSMELFENVSFVEDAVYADCEGMADEGCLQGVYHFRVRKHKDATIIPRMSDDKMKAWVDIYPPEGSGFPPDRESLEDRLAEAGIQVGILEEALDEAVARVNNNETVENLLAAQGKLPSHALEGHLILHFDWDWNHPPVKELPVVEEDQLIAEILPPPKEKEDGYDLTGRVLPAKETFSFDFTPGENIRTQERDDGRTFLYAERKGEISLNHQGIAVNSVKDIDGNVSLRTGSIDFVGEVTVHGSVESGYYIMAGSSVRIGELVYNALISSDTDITVKQGVVGSGKAVLRARNSINLGYAEQAHLMSVGELVIRKSALNCQIKCNGRIHFGKEQSRLVGGETKTKHGLSVVDLGSTSGEETKICFGQDYLVLDMIEVEERRIEKLRATLERVDTLMEKLKKNGETQKLIPLRKKKVKAMRMIEKRTMRIFNLRERFEEHFAGEIRVRGSLFPGVVIETHSRELKISQRQTNVSVVFNQDNGKIEINSIDSNE